MFLKTLNSRCASVTIHRRRFSYHRKLNKYSSKLTEEKVHGGARAMLIATGVKEEDLTKPQIGIASMWWEGNPCNMHLLGLSKHIKDSIESEGMLGMRFNTIGVSDAMSMGTEGMCYSLQSRDLIADSIETVMKAQWYDGCICIPGCDKNMPGSVIAMIRINRPSLVIYGGTIQPGCLNGRNIDIVNAFQCYGEYIANKISDDERKEILRHACPGPGACGGMYTANTMATIIETLGLSLPYSSSAPAVSSEKIKECRLIGKTMRNLIENDIKPLDILTPKSFENAIAVTMALGGSTNAVLHLIAIARAANIPLTIDDFQEISQRIPFIADLKPSGQFLMGDLHSVGGVPAVLKYMLEKNMIDGDCLTVTGKTLGENVRNIPGLSDNHKIIHPVEKPIKTSGHIKILKGNLAPEGSVAKITGKEGEIFEGTAMVFDCEEDMLTALNNEEIKRGTVIVIRYEGPKGGPGMPEMLTCTASIMGAGLASHVAILTDGRFSGGSHGFLIGHITPEAQVGGPIALVRNGDKIKIDAVNCTIDVLVSNEELKGRENDWKPPPLKATRGTLYKYIKNVTSASDGCVTDE